MADTGIFSRINMIVKSNINSLLDQFENPEKMIDQCIIDAKREFAQLKLAVGEVGGTLKVEEKRLAGLEDDIKKWNGVAEKAVLAGNDADAKTALTRAAESKQRLESQREVVQGCRASYEKAEASFNQMGDSIRQMELKKGELKSKAVAARSKQKANEINGTSGSLAQFNNMAEKLEREVAKQEAIAELDAPDKSDEALVNKYSSPDVDDDLAALKERLGK